MSARIHPLPVVPRISPLSAAWREQYDRECAAVFEAMREPPPRTRPILVRQLTTCQREEGEQ